MRDFDQSRDKSFHNEDLGQFSFRDRPRSKVQRFRDPEAAEEAELESKSHEVLKKRIKADRAERLRNSFICASKRCKAEVAISTPAAGTEHRNHCPCCLTSKHVDDNIPGDRSSLCGATMPAIAVVFRNSEEIALVHKCNGCDKININRVAGDDSSEAIFGLVIRVSQETITALQDKLIGALTIATPEDIDIVESALLGKPKHDDAEKA